MEEMRDMVIRVGEVRHIRPPELVIDEFDD
jgi:hypothetical protein